MWTAIDRLLALVAAAQERVKQVRDGYRERRKTRTKDRSKEWDKTLKK